MRQCPVRSLHSHLSIPRLTVSKNRHKWRRLSLIFVDKSDVYIGHWPTYTQAQGRITAFYRSGLYDIRRSRWPLYVAVTQGLSFWHAAWTCDEIASRVFSPNTGNTGSTAVIAWRTVWTAMGKRVWWRCFMASGINIYSELVISRIRIPDIRNCNCWYQ